MIGILLDNLFFLGYICTGALATVVLLFAFLAPFESLLWWKDLKFAPARFVKRLQKFECKEKNTDADFFIVYLSGVGVISGDGLAADEQHFVDRLQHHFPHAAIVTDVFPYSAESDSLSSDRFFPKLWKYLEKNRLTNKKNVLDFLILLRNALQLAVATDDRYAPIYNLGTTTLILQGLLKKGYDLRDQKPICLIGYSGGAQIAVGAATYLHEIIHAPISMITIGGAINDDPGLNAITHLDYLYSPKDPVVMSMPWLFSGRMPFNVFSLWNQSVREGKITYTNVGNCSHAYAYSYFDTLHTLPDTHHTYAQKPLQTTVELLETTIPVNSFTTAVKKIRAMMHEEKALVDPKHNSILLTHGKKTHDVLTIFHGYTNSPPQFLRLALSFYEKGFTVYIPRLPEHGYKEKYYKRTDEMTATKLVDATNKFLDISQQLGDQVHVMGLSLGGVLATYAAQYRNITSAFIIAPSLRIYGINNGWLQLLRFFPGIFIPWTLSAYNKTIATSYSHFSVKGMGESLYLANGILADAKRHTPKAREVTFLLNAQDKAISNDAVHQLQKEWEHHEFSNTTIFTIPKGIVNTHDIISPLEKGENINYVYPVILDLFFKENKKEKIRQ
jgi:esterase/lipase